MNDQPDFSKGDGLLPAIVQSSLTGRVLMLGYMTEESFARTRKSGRVTFFSRSRSQLWEKGETSGNGLVVEEISLDCDRDAILIRARPEGPTCHTGSESCFESSAPTFLERLEMLIAQRRDERPEGSYTTKLFDEGRSRIAQKVGEEALETALAAVQNEKNAVVSESADLLYHLIVLLAHSEIELREVVSELDRRHHGD